MIKAIETVYNGYRFRSRLEARWAVFFDTLGIKYEYEPEGYDLGDAGWYLPDFWLQDFELWAEIKGDWPSQEDMFKAKRLCEGTKNDVAVFAKDVWYAPAYALYEYDRETKHGIDRSYFSEYDTGDGYDWAYSGKGQYYQGWTVWGLCPSYRFDYKPIVMPIVLMEPDDIRAATHPIIHAAYTAARQARFEHGENGS